MRYEISEPYQQYQYFIEVNDVRNLKHIKFTTAFQGAKFPDASQTKLEFFLTEIEWENLRKVFTV
jgi:hypothetical protein